MRSTAKYLGLCLVAAMIPCATILVGCSGSVQRTILREEMREDVKINELLLDTGEIVRFGDEGGRYIDVSGGKEVRPEIIGRTRENKVVEIDPASVLDARVEKEEADPVKSLLFLMFGLPLIVLGIFVLFAIL